MAKAILLDFYGTVVHEDDTVIGNICRAISDASPVATATEEIGSYWWSVLSRAFRVSYGDNFETQRVLEHASLKDTCEHFKASCDVLELSEMMFAHWQNAPIFEDAQRFLSTVNLPIVVLSNIDRADIETAIAAHGLAFNKVITSEDVRSYKPRHELFRAGLNALGLTPSDVLHVGDSVTSDVIGANELGIPVAWVNRTARAAPTTGEPDFEVSTLAELTPNLLSSPSE